MPLQASDFSSSSSSSSFSYKWRYHVFLSFRGSDTRYGFTGHLYEALRGKGIDTFIDHENLQGGEEITPALVEAIQDSRIAIVVFSVNYAFSSFCLDELAKIMKCVKEKGRLVLPVFYDVDPCDVRHQKVSFGEAMTKHEERFKDDKEKVQKWREALRQAANLSGEVFKLARNEYEYVCIKKIVKVISKNISRVPLHIPKYLVGLESQVLEVNSLLNDGFDCGVRMVGIHGIGGMGKTTLAQVIYNFIADQFECLCFLGNVSEKTITFGLVHLQEKLLSEMLGEQNIKLGSVHHGIPIIKQRLHRKKVLLVLDDVDKLEQLEALVGEADWFGSGSRVIITTRDKHLLAIHGVKRNYEVKGLSKKEALKLLGWHAFKSKIIDPSYMDILKHGVTYACGLPLALKVIGSNLFGKSIEQQRSALNQYEKILNEDIQKILKISFDALEECHKKIFLDIACCCNGYKWAEVQDILRARYGLSLEYGISVLIQKSLIMDDMYGYVTIHDLIRDMGREIIRQESPEDPGNRSRLWILEDAAQVLEGNTGTKKIEIMILDAPKLEKIVVEWDGEAFKKMRNLEILIIRNIHLSQGAKHLPSSLRVLEWWNYPSNSLPSDFYPKKLAILKLPCSSLMSDGIVDMRKFIKLEVLNLDKSNIEYIPDVSGVPNLQKLSFLYCKNLIKVHESVGFLDKLSELGVSGCSKLRGFPALKLRCLERLDFRGCSSLENFPEILGDMEGLKHINLYNTSIKELPYSFINLRKGRDLTFGDGNVGSYGASGRISMWHDLVVHVQPVRLLPTQDEDEDEDEEEYEGQWSDEDEYEGQWSDEDEYEGQWSPLLPLDAVNNVSVVFRNTLDQFFATMLLSLFRHVVALDLSGNDFIILPESIKELCSVRKLTLDDCKELREIKGIPPNIEEFSAANCMSLTPSCRSSMLLNEEYYSSNGYKRFYFPGGGFPKWFENSSRNSISFCCRNKLPSISLCVVWRSNRSCYATGCIRVEVSINGKKRYSFVNNCRFTRAEDHIIILNRGRILSDHEEILSENEWNHVVCRVARNIEGCPLVTEDIGIHVHKHKSNIEDIRFTNPLLQEKEVNMGDFHRDTEQEKNLTTLASVETQRGKWLSLHLPQAMNLFNDDVNGDLNSGSDDGSWKRDMELLSLRPCSEESLGCANLESNLKQLAPTSDTIKDQGCEKSSRKRGESALMLDLNNEPISEMELESNSGMARDTISEGGDKCLPATEREGPERAALTNFMGTMSQFICKCFGF